MLLTLHPAYICLASACDWNQRETSGSIPLTIGFESTGHVRQNSARAGHQLFPGDLQTSKYHCAIWVPPRCKKQYVIVDQLF